MPSASTGRTPRALASIHDDGQVPRADRPPHPEMLGRGRKSRHEGRRCRCCCCCCCCCSRGSQWCRGHSGGATLARVRNGALVAAGAGAGGAEAQEPGRAGRVGGFCEVGPVYRPRRRPKPRAAPPPRRRKLAKGRCHRGRAPVQKKNGICPRERSYGGSGGGWGRPAATAATAPSRGLPWPGYSSVVKGGRGS